MDQLLELLNADFVAVRACRDKLSEYLTDGKPYVVTVNGEPRNVLMPYKKMITLLARLSKMEKEIAHAHP